MFCRLQATIALHVTSLYAIFLATASPIVLINNNRVFPVFMVDVNTHVNI